MGDKAKTIGGSRGSMNWHDRRWKWRREQKNLATATNGGEMCCSLISSCLGDEALPSSSATELCCKAYDGSRDLVIGAKEARMMAKDAVVLLELSRRLG